MTDPYVLVVPRDSPLAGKRRLRIPEISALPLIGFRSCRNEHRVEAQLRARGREPSIVFRSDDNPTVQALVAAGIGAALMPRLTADLDDARTRWIDVGGLFPPRVLGLVWHCDRDVGAAMSAFITMVKAVCTTIGK